MRLISALVFFIFSVPLFAQINPLGNSDSIARIAEGRHTQGIDIALIYQQVESVKQQQLQNELLELQIQKQRMQLEQARKGLIPLSSVETYIPPPLHNTYESPPTQRAYAPVQEIPQYGERKQNRIRYITGGSQSGHSSYTQPHQYNTQSYNNNQSNFSSMSGHIENKPIQILSETQQWSTHEGGPVHSTSSYVGHIGNKQIQGMSQGTQTSLYKGGPTVSYGSSRGQIGNQQYMSSTMGNQTSGIIGNQRFNSITDGNVTTYRMGGKTIICIRSENQTSCR